MNSLLNSYSVFSDGGWAPSVVTDRHGAHHIEEDAGVGPLFEPRETRHEYSYRAEHVPNPDRQEVQDT